MSLDDGDPRHGAPRVRRRHAPGPKTSVLMVVANPTTPTTTGWPAGFWAAELFHPLYEFTKPRYR
jgi:hypothetical protein